MTAELIFDGRAVDIGQAIDISIPLEFNGPQPNAFGVPRAIAEACEGGGLVGDTRRGGSCNFEQYTLIPHCNGTHTECVGHITNERIAVTDCLRDVLINSLLVRIEPEKAIGCGESYSVPFGENDLVITGSILKRAMADRQPLAGPTALIISTLPNDESKRSREYGDEPLPPYFTTEAVEYIVECEFDHLLVDMPSIDRMHDEGRLSNHRFFWRVGQGSFETGPRTRISSTITELIYVPNEVEEGEYLLNLQIAPFASDASPSRPVLFRYV